MNPYVQDLRNVQGESLAAVHYKNRYIQEDHCYTCHSDYGMAGTVMAKFAGLGHVWRYTTGTYTLPLKIASPYSNTALPLLPRGLAEVSQLRRAPEGGRPRALGRQRQLSLLSCARARGDQGGEPMTQLRVAMLCTAVGLLLSLGLLVRETPYTWTAFMFIGQPLLFAGMLLLLISVVAELRHRGVL